MLKLPDRRLEKLSDIASDTGLVVLATVFLPSILDKTEPALAAIGLAGTAVL